MVVFFSFRCGEHIPAQIGDPVFTGYQKSSGFWCRLTWTPARSTFRAARPSKKWPL